MKNRILLPTIALLMFAYPSGSQVLRQPGARQDSTVTLFSGIKHRDQGLRSCLNFPASPSGPGCDLRYGALYAGDDLDWFESSTAQGNRSVIIDLGAHEWNAEFKVPVIEPLATFGRQLSVLLVDDEDLVRTATAEMIRDLGHTVVEAGGGLEALARLDGGLSVDVVVTDYMMPGMDGGLLARRIAETHPKTAVLLITGYTGPTNDVMHLPRLAKPFGQAEIAASLASLFARDADNVVHLPKR